MKTPIAYLDEGSYWEALTDAQIRSTEFEIERPEDIEGLTLQPPPPGSPRPRIEYHYDTRKSDKRLVRCAHCGFENHNDGFVCLNQDGSRFLVGNRCGEKIFPDNFQLMLNSFKQAKSRASLMLEVEIALAALPNEAHALEAFLAEPDVDKFDNAKRLLRSMFPGAIGKELRTAVDRDGQLFVDKKVRDFAAEEKHRAKYDAVPSKDRNWQIRNGMLRKRDTQIFRTVQEPVGFITGFRLISDHPPLRLTLSSMLDRLRSAEVIEPQPMQRKLWLKNLRDLRLQIREATALVKLLPLFFSERNFRILATWIATKHSHLGTLDVSKTQAVWTASDGSSSVANLYGY